MELIRRTHGATLEPNRQRKELTKTPCRNHAGKQALWRNFKASTYILNKLVSKNPTTEQPKGHIPPSITQRSDLRLRHWSFRSYRLSRVFPLERQCLCVHWVPWPGGDFCNLPERVWSFATTLRTRPLWSGVARGSMDLPPSSCCLAGMNDIYAWFILSMRPSSECATTDYFRYCFFLLLFI